MALCSGQFIDTPSLTNDDHTPNDHSSKFDDSDVISQIDAASQEIVPLLMSAEKEIEIVCNQPADESLSKENVPTSVEQPQNAKKPFESSDDEADNETEEIVEKRRVKKKSKKKAVKLGFSDDEEDEQFQDAQKFYVESSEEECEEECVEEEEDEQEEVLVDYDSEENEIEVKMSKNDKIKEARKYFENEAELSETEWGSADEDEKGLDKYEQDIADNEHYDEDKLREEVGRIHARKMMDEDQKNVKKIEDLLFENEENDGVGRERKFRWKNQTEGFTLDDENARDADECGENDMDDECEATWRKMRHERETLISEQSIKMLESDTQTGDILLLDQNSQTVTSTSTSLVKKKFQIIRTSSSSIGGELSSKKDSPFLIKTDHRKFSSSFLSKGDKALAKIASFISNKGGDDELTNLSSHGGGNSMSFAPIDKPTVEGKKRKSDGNDNGAAQKTDFKKRKVENHRFLLDQLL
jgi:hypothetical protein